MHIFKDNKKTTTNTLVIIKEFKRLFIKEAHRHQIHKKKTIATHIFLYRFVFLVSMQIMLLLLKKVLAL